MPNLHDDILSKKDCREQEAYLNSLYNEAINNKDCAHLGEDAGADEIMQALVEYLQKKYKPEELNLATLHEIYKNLDAWNPEEKVGMNAYIFRSVQSALMCITFESLDAAIKIMDETCLQYLYELEKELQKKPYNKLTQKRRLITSEAHSFLQDEELSDREKASLFCEKISDNHVIFNKEQHPKTILFLKAVAVFAAFCVGAGIGGVLAYQKLFNKKNDVVTLGEQFKHSIFDQRNLNDATSEEEKDNQEAPKGPSTN
jgi:hypothetical protein